MAIIEIDEIEYKVPHQVAALLQTVSEERDKLKKLVMWITRWDCDLRQFHSFSKKRDELLKN